VLKIERVGEPTAVESPELPDGTVRLRITVRISVDDKAWRVRMEKAQTTLSELAIAKASTVIPLRKCAPVEEVNDRSGSVRIEREKPANVDGMVLDAPSLASMDPEAAIGRSGRFLPQIWHAAVEAGPGDTAFTSKLRDSILLRSLVTESRARNQNLAVACIIDRKPESTSVTVHSFVVPEAVLDGCFRGYTGRLALSASALDVSGSEISGGTAGLSVLGAWSLDPELGFNGGVAVSGLMRQAFLLGGRGRLDLASNPDLGSGLSITQGGREQKPSILVIAPGAAYLNPCGPSCYSGMAIASSWTGDMFLDLPDSALESMESLRLEIEPK
jgi:hypothetical protein